MIHAAYFNQPKIIEYLNSLGCSVEQEGRNGDSPLNRACYYNRQESISELIRLGANINAKHVDYPLVQSIYRGKPGLIEFLITKGVDLSILDHEENLHVLASASPEIRFIIKRHKCVLKRLPFLCVLTFSNSPLKRLPTGILKDVINYIS